MSTLYSGLHNQAFWVTDFYFKITAKLDTNIELRHFARDLIRVEFISYEIYDRTIPIIDFFTRYKLVLDCNLT